MNIIRINQSKVELRNRAGILQRVISDGAQSAYLNESGDTVLITKLNGRVELRSITGILQRVITEGAQDARFTGKDIFIQKMNKSELRNNYGQLIRYI
jgi:hypothetical protein